jgi:hypothetical protein
MLSEPQFADSLPLLVAKDMLIFRSTVLASDGDLEGAFGAAEKIERLAKENAVVWYDAARCYSICSDTSGLTKTSDGETAVEVRQRCTNAALRCLSKAIDCGFKNLARLQIDPDLKSLRGNREFQSLLKRIGKT